VLAKGKLPCDVLFVGEAPGESEDVTGTPFIGPAGRLLDEMIANAGYNRPSEHRLMTPKECDCGGDTGYCNICDGGLGFCLRCRKGESELSEPCLQLRLAFTNVVGCIPRGDDGNKMLEPDDSHAEACQPRLVDIVHIADPRLIVQVGTFAETWTQPNYKHSPKFHKPIPMVKIVHPAAILRSRVDQKDYQKQLNVIALSDALELLATEGK
jgi:uracil-DNA glycosylase